MTTLLKKTNDCHPCPMGYDDHSLKKTTTKEWMSLSHQLTSALKEDKSLAVFLYASDNVIKRNHMTYCLVSGHPMITPLKKDNRFVVSLHGIRK